jgi:hypothetical protein
LERACVSRLDRIAGYLGVLGIRGHNLPARVRLTSDLIGQ